MKEAYAVTANYCAALNNGTLTPTVEVAVLVSEPDYKRDKNGVVKGRQCETIRFVARTDKLKELAAMLKAFAVDAEGEFAAALRKQGVAQPEPESENPKSDGHSTNQESTGGQG